MYYIWPFSFIIQIQIPNFAINDQMSNSAKIFSSIGHFMLIM